MRNSFFLVLLSIISTFSCWGQEDSETIPLVYQSTMIGYGRNSVYDSYLSPLKYKGNNIGIFYEHMKMTGLMNGNVSAQHQFNLDFSWSDNESETASDYTGFVEYSYGLHYRFKPAPKFQISAGMQANGVLGFIYNTRNGNNPATGKAHINLNLSAIAAYNVKLKSQPIHFRYQINMPFSGIMFSPEFGQSYYEISLGNNDNLVHFASFHNYISVRNILTAEVPLNRFTIRLSYINSIYETRVNGLDTRLCSNTFYIGLSRNFYTVSSKKSDRGNYLRVFE